MRRWYDFDCNSATAFPSAHVMQLPTTGYNLSCCSNGLITQLEAKAHTSLQQRSGASGNRYQDAVSSYTITAVSAILDCHCASWPTYKYTGIRLLVDTRTQISMLNDTTSQHSVTAKPAMPALIYTTIVDFINVCLEKLAARALHMAL